MPDDEEKVIQELKQVEQSELAGIPRIWKVVGWGCAIICLLGLLMAYLLAKINP